MSGAGIANPQEMELNLKTPNLYLGTPAAPNQIWFSDVGNQGNEVSLTVNNALSFHWTTTLFRPHTDSDVSLGSSAAKWSNFFSAAAQINALNVSTTGMSSTAKTRLAPAISGNLINVAEALGLLAEKAWNV